MARNQRERQGSKAKRAVQKPQRQSFWTRLFTRIFRGRRWRKLLLYATPLWLLLVFLIATNIWMVYTTRDALFTDAEAIGFNETGLVLGTSKWFRSGRPNLFFKHRMEAAAKLYHAGKVHNLLVSGIRVPGYNEPREMKKSLLALGVPETAIREDFEGARTLDSVKRAKHVFGLQKLTIISQANHNYRAVYLARSMKMEVLAFSAQEVAFRHSFRVRLREYLARAKAVLDVLLLESEPPSPNLPGLTQMDALRKNPPVSLFQWI